MRRGLGRARIYARKKSRWARLRIKLTSTCVGTRTGKALVVCNGAYGRRIVQMLKYMNRAHTAIDLDEEYVRANDESNDEAGWGGVGLGEA